MMFPQENLIIVQAWSTNQSQLDQRYSRGTFCWSSCLSSWTYGTSCQTLYCSQLLMTHWWRLTPLGQYSAKSSYEGFFHGSIQFQSCEHILKPWVQGKWRFIVWFVVHKCWTADQLAWWGLPHLELSPMWWGWGDRIDHLLTVYLHSCPVFFSWASSSLTFNRGSVLDDWWSRVNGVVTGPAAWYFKDSIPSSFLVHGPFRRTGTILSSMVITQIWLMPW